MKAIVTVAGRDCVGIIAGVCTRLADLGINILDISQTVLQQYFTMMMVVDMSGSDISFEKVQSSLNEFGEEMGLNIRLQRTDIFDAMHQI